MKVVFILAVAAVAANLFSIWYAKKKRNKNKADRSSNLNDTNTPGLLKSAEANTLKQSAAEELSVTVEDLDRMSVEEITQLAKNKGLI
jgi:hypothetical protein